MPSEELLSKFNQIKDLFEHSPNLIKDYQFFYINKSYSYSLKNMRIHIEDAQKNFYEIRTLNLDRGKILSLFSKLEFLVNECLRLFFLGLGKNEEFEKLIEYVNFGQRVKSLRNCKLISSSVSKKIANVAFVRNQIAHMWQIADILYLEKPLTEDDVFKRFKKDFEEVFSDLIDYYQSLLGKLNFGEYLEKIISNAE